MLMWFLFSCLRLLLTELFHMIYYVNFLDAWITELACIGNLPTSDSSLFYHAQILTECLLCVYCWLFLQQIHVCDHLQEKALLKDITQEFSSQDTFHCVLPSARLALSLHTRGVNAPELAQVSSFSSSCFFSWRTDQVSNCDAVTHRFLYPSLLQS